MTVSTVRRASRPSRLVSSRYRDSGVVTTKAGGLRTMAVRWELDVSPVRTATRMGAGSSPISVATLEISANGRSRFSAMSTASAFNGDTYSTRVPAAMSCPASCSRYRESMATRNPARVLPEPVGAAIRVSSPAEMSGHPLAWGLVGPSGNRRRNHSATAG